MRHDVHTIRSADAPPPAAARDGARVVRQGVAPALHPVLRAILLPFALLLAALGGLVFAILLPVCGIATIAEAVAKATWSFVRGAMPHTVSQSASRN